MKKMNDADEGYGKCDEIDGPDECEGCTGCKAVVADDPQHVFELAETKTPPGTKTQTVRIRVTDLAVLHELRQTDDDTPAGVLHRVLAEREAMLQSQTGPVVDEDALKKHEALIAKQKEKIATQRREVDELQNTMKVLKSAAADNGENRGELEKEYVEKLATFQDQREKILETMREMTAEYQADLADRERTIEELEEELDEIRYSDSEHVCAGATTINIHIHKGSRTGEE